MLYGEWHREERGEREPRARLRLLPEPRPVLELHLLPGQPAPATSSSRPTGAGSAAPARTTRASTCSSSARCRTRSGSSCAATASTTACSRPCARTGRDKPDYDGDTIPATTRRDDLWQISLGPYLENQVEWLRLAAQRGRRARRLHPLRRRRRQRHGVRRSRRRHRQPQGQPDLRALARQRALPLRRHGLPQQRRARRHRQHRLGRPDGAHLRGGDRRPHQLSAGPPDHGRLLVARRRLRAALRRRRRHHRGRPVRAGATASSSPTTTP